MVRGMSLDAGSLVVGLLASSVGFGLFLYGKKQRRGPQLLAGVLLMVVPFAPIGAWLQLGASALLVTLLWLAVRAGW